MYAFIVADALMQILKRIKKAQKNMKEIGGFADVELTVLAHLLYKNHNRFRNDKGFKDLKMVKKAALRLYQEVNLPKLMKGFLEDMPVPFDIRKVYKIIVSSKKRGRRQFSSPKVGAIAIFVLAFHLLIYIQ